MVGLMSELFIRRFIDHQSKWRRNDLIDMFHLSSAAAYVTYVCAETHTGTQLRDAQRALGEEDCCHNMGRPSHRYPPRWHPYPGRASLPLGKILRLTVKDPVWPLGQSVMSNYNVCAPLGTASNPNAARSPSALLTIGVYEMPPPETDARDSGRRGRDPDQPLQRWPSRTLRCAQRTGQGRRMN